MEIGLEPRDSFGNSLEGVTSGPLPPFHVCPMCQNKVLDQRPPRGNPRVYCSPKCRTRAWRVRKELRWKKPK